MDHLLDIFFFLFHTILTLFNLLAWIWPKTRKANLTSLLLTAFSWFFLGIWYGVGYCPFTDWHWQVRARLGDTVLPASYIKFLLDTLTGGNWNALLVESATAVAFFLALAISVFLNWRDYKKKRVSD